MIEYLIYACILLPALSTVLIICFSDNANLRDCVSIITSILLFFMVAYLYKSVDVTHGKEYVLLDIIKNLSIAFHIEPLGLLFALIASTLWVATNIYAIGYMRLNKEKHQTRFYSFFALSISMTMAIAFSSNMLTLFLFYELLTLLTYPLVTHSGTQQARISGRIYLGILLLTSIGLQLTAIVCVWTMTNTLSFQPSGVFSHIETDWLLLIYIIFILGVGKAALMPFHHWLPAAMVAPTPVSALLHAVAVVKAGVFTIVKASFYLFGLDNLQGFQAAEYLYLIPGVTIVLASMIALQQDNLKKRLAYSTISQLSYVVLATVILTPLSVVAAGMHILAHAFGKITLFFAAGSIYTMSKKTNISDMQGIGKQMPITMLAFSIGSLSMIGVPPTIGFLSKWFIIDSAFLAQHTVVVFILLVSTLLNAAYYLPICYQAFFHPSSSGCDIHTIESPPAITLPLIFTAMMSLLLFFFPDPFLSLLNMLLT